MDVLPVLVLNFVMYTTEYWN